MSILSPVDDVFNSETNDDKTRDRKNWSAVPWLCVVYCTSYLAGEKLCCDEPTRLLLVVTFYICTDGRCPNILNINSISLVKQTKISFMSWRIFLLLKMSPCLKDLNTSTYIIIWVSQTIIISIANSIYINNRGIVIQY